MLPGLLGAKRVFHTTIRILMAAGALALAVTACEPDVSVAPTVAPLTQPPAAVSTPAATVIAPGQSPAVPADVAAHADERMAELTGRILRPRPVEVDVLWSALLAYRAHGVRANHAPDIDAPAKMLEMWRPDNQCYAMLEGEVEQLGAKKSLGPVEFNAYFDHIFARLSPCLDEQWPQVDPQQFFANSDTLRADRGSAWFDSIWVGSDGEALTSLDHCREGFDAHLPAVASAGEPGELHFAWGTAMAEFSDCGRQALYEELPFVSLGESQLFAFELNDRYTLIALQATLGGHLVGISMQRPYDTCWPDFEAGIPEIAVATGPAQLVESRDAALGALRDCIERLPEYNPYPAR